MPDIDEGLEINGEPLVSHEEGDVNTQSGFEAGLARAVTGEETETVEEAPPAPETEEDTEEAPDEEEAAPEDTWRVRYEEAQKLIGRMSEEVRDARAQLSELQVQPEYAPPSAPINVEQLIDQVGGNDAIEWAIDNAPDQIETIARSWALSGDPEGAVFYADYRAEKSQLDYAPPSMPEPDPTITEMANQQKLVQVFKEARNDDPQFASYEPGIPLALGSKELPDEIRMMLTSGNLDHMRSGVQFLKPYAQIEAIKAGTAKTSPEPPGQGDTPAEQARRDAARRTAIVTGSQRLQPAGAQPDAGEMTSEQRIARFKEAFEEEPSTSIAAGLTINGQPVLPPRPKRPQ